MYLPNDEVILEILVHVDDYLNDRVVLNRELVLMWHEHAKVSGYYEN